MADGTHPRRTILRALGTAGTLPLADCANPGTEPTVSVPGESLVDERVAIELDGLPANEAVTLRATGRSDAYQTTVFGGTAAANAQASADSWSRTRSFFERALGSDAPGHPPAPTP